MARGAGGYAGGMLPARTGFLFGDFRIATVAEGRGAFAHTFGGPHDRAGAGRAACNGVLVHLLYRLDTTDPAVPVRVPGVRWLPLYYCFDFRANDLGYRLLSDTEMVTFFPADDPNVSAEESWPGDDYPTEFPRRAVAVAPHPYDPTDLDDAYNWAGVFGIGRLSARRRRAARARVARLAERLGFFVPETDAEFDAALARPYEQGKPNAPCPNPACPNHARRGRLVPVALVPAEPVPGVHTFGAHGDGVIVTFHQCPECYTMRASNQST